MFVVVREDDAIEERVAYLFDTKEDAISYMLKDFEKTKRETIDNREEIYNRGVFECNTHAFIETEITEYHWDVIEVLDKEEI